MLAGKIQEYYGKTREQAEKELDRWCEQQQRATASSSGQESARPPNPDGSPSEGERRREDGRAAVPS